MVAFRKWYYPSNRGPGGSTGGEGALFAAGGTPFGTGSDLLGSMRIPSQFCGLTQLKPTSVAFISFCRYRSSLQSRFVVHGSDGGVPGRGRLGQSYGFYTKTVREQVLLLREVKHLIITYLRRSTTTLDICRYSAILRTRLSCPSRRVSH